MKEFLLIIATLMTTILYAQEKIEVDNRNGVYVSYELTKLSAGEKKDKYLAIVQAENRTDADVYYNVPLTKNANGIWELNALQYKGFCQLSVRNCTGLLGEFGSIIGQESKLTTNDNQVLFAIQKGQILSTEIEFNVKAGEKPIVTNTFLESLEGLDFFDVALNETAINGDWTSSCGNIQMNLTLTKDPKGETSLMQLINGKQIEWKKNNASTFQKLNDNNSTLVYNKTNQSFNYSTTDGVSCTWLKK